MKSLEFKLAAEGLTVGELKRRLNLFYDDAIVTAAWFEDIVELGILNDGNDGLAAIVFEFQSEQDIRDDDVFVLTEQGRARLAEI